MKKITRLCMLLGILIYSSSFGQFTEGFEGDVFPPEGWSIFNGGGANTWVSHLDSYGSLEGDKYTRIRYESDKHDDYLITPAITVNNGVNDRISFNVKSYSGSFPDAYEVVLSTTDTASTSFSVTLQEEVDAPNNWEKIEFDLSAYQGQTVYVAVKAVSQYQYYLQVDNVINDAKPSCELPSNLNAVVLDGASVQLSWEAGANEVAWNLEYGVKDFELGSGTTLALSDTATTISNLTPNTDYDFYVQADCGAQDGVSQWVGPFSWYQIQAPDCPIVTSPTDAATGLSALAVDVSWDVATTGGAPDTYEIRLGESPTSLTYYSTVYNPQTTSYTFSNLSPSTTYYWSVIAVNSSGQSTDCSIQSFTTEACQPVSAPYVLTFDDESVTGCIIIDDLWEIGEPGGFFTEFDNVGDAGVLEGTTTSQNKFIYVKDNFSTDSSTLTTQLVDVSSLTSPILSFFVISDNQSTSSLQIPNASFEVEFYNGSQWVNVGSYKGNTNGWKKYVIDLTDQTISGLVQVRFVVYGSGSYRDSVAFDDISLKDASSTFDAGADVLIKTPTEIAAGQASSVASVYVAPGASLTIKGDLTATDGVRISSGASLIVEGTLNAKVFYERAFTKDRWYLAASPVSGETLDNFILGGVPLTAGTLGNLGIGTYTPTESSWNYVTSSSTGLLEQGKGYAITLSESKTIDFAGTVGANDVAASITNEGDQFNFVGNPFPSYVNLGTLINRNSANLSEATLWFWDGTSYVQKLLGIDAAYQIAPGQGFFVKAATQGDFVFDKTNQSHAADTFMRAAEKTNVVLSVTDSKNTLQTKLYYLDSQVSKGFDNGFDGSVFPSSSAFKVYTAVVDQNSSHILGVQSLPKAQMETIAVPVGVVAKSGAHLSFSAASFNLPDGVQVYLEDKINRTIVNLSEQNYDLVLQQESKGTGNFFIYTTSEKKVVDQPINLDLAILKKGASSIYVQGLSSTSATLELYSITGEKVYSSQVTNAQNLVKLPKLATGVYVAKLVSGEQVVTNKLIF